SDPENPRFVHSFCDLKQTSVCDNFYSVAAANGYIYAACRRSFFIGKLTGDTISKVKYVVPSTAFNDAEKVLVKNNYLFVGDKNSVQIFNLASPENPQFVTRIVTPLTHDAGQMNIDENYLILRSTGKDIFLYDISSVSSPVLTQTINDFGTNGSVNDARYHNEMLYVVCNYNSDLYIRVYDVSTINSPVCVQSSILSTTTYNAGKLFFRGTNYAYFISTNYLMAIDMQEPGLLYSYDGIATTYTFTKAKTAYGDTMVYSAPGQGFFGLSIDF
ncbi:MAG: hypothetical protein EHM28_06360, partial [Spirochaetaceae bacterium]